MVTPPTIEVANLGMADSLILMVLALVVFGPRRLPQIGRQIGKLMFEFRKASNDFKYQMEEELRNAEDADRRKKEEERQRQLALSAPAQESVSADPPAAASVTESPYPDGAEFPEVTAVNENRIQDAVPRIQPPSTGEIIASERPWRETASDNGAEAPPSSATEEPKTEAVEPACPVPDQPGATDQTSHPTDQSAPATEAVSHNG